MDVQHRSSIDAEHPTTAQQMFDAAAPLRGRCARHLPNMPTVPLSEFKLAMKGTELCRPSQTGSTFVAAVQAR
jgi:hypothetical protein